MAWPKTSNLWEATKKFARKGAKLTAAVLKFAANVGGTAVASVAAISVFTGIDPLEVMFTGYGVVVVGIGISASVINFGGVRFLKMLESDDKKKNPAENKKPVVAIDTPALQAANGLIWVIDISYMILTSGMASMASAIYLSLFAVRIGGGNENTPLTDTPEKAGSLLTWQLLLCFSSMWAHWKSTHYLIHNDFKQRIFSGEVFHYQCKTYLMWGASLVIAGLTTKNSGEVIIKAISKDGFQVINPNFNAQGDTYPYLYMVSNVTLYAITNLPMFEKRFTSKNLNEAFEAEHPRARELIPECYSGPRYPTVRMAQFAESMIQGSSGAGGIAKAAVGIINESGSNYTPQSLGVLIPSFIIGIVFNTYSNLAYNDELLRLEMNRRYQRRVKNLPALPPPATPANAVAVDIPPQLPPAASTLKTPLLDTGHDSALAEPLASQPKSTPRYGSYGEYDFLLFATPRNKSINSKNDRILLADADDDLESRFSRPGPQAANNATGTS